MALFHRCALPALSVALLLALSAPATAANALPDDVCPSSAANPATPAGPAWKIAQLRTTLFHDAQNLIKAEQAKEGLDKLCQVLELSSSPEALLWAGFAVEQLGNTLKAKQIYLQAKADAHAAKLKQDEANAEQALAAIASKVPRVVVHLPEGVEAALEIDKVQFAPTTEGVEVEVGSHIVEVKAQGRQTYHSEIVAKAGQLVVLEAALPVRPPPPPKADPTPLEEVDPGPRGCTCEVPRDPGGHLAGWAVAAGTALLSAYRRRARRHS